MAVFDLRNSTIIVEDATAPTPNTLTIQLSEGQFEYSETINYNVIRDRHLIEAFRKADEEPMTVTIAALFLFIKGETTNVTLPDALKGINTASDWVGTNSDPCDPYCVDLILTHIPPCSQVQQEVMTFPKFHVTSINPDFSAGVLNLEGMCLATTPTLVREAQD